MLRGFSIARSSSCKRVIYERRAGPQYKAAPSVTYGADLRVSEVAYLKVPDNDSERMTLRVKGKGQRDRYVMLSPQLLELLRDWWRPARLQVWLSPVGTRSIRSSVSSRYSGILGTS